MSKSNPQKAINTAFFSIITNVVLAVVKAVAGYFGNSFALIADAIESATDVFSSLLVLLGLRYSAKPADENHPYGHGKVEPLLTFVVVAILMISATFIVVESISNITEPHEAPKGYTLLVLGAIILVKELVYRYVRNRGKETRSTALQADAWHHRSDAITSLVAFVGIAISLVLGEGYENADDWAALLAAGFIAYNAYLIFRPALGEVMDEQLQEHSELIAQVREVASAVEGVRDTEKCFIRKSGMFFHVDLHIEVEAEITVREGHEISHMVKDRLRSELPEIADVLIHIEPDA